MWSGTAAVNNVEKSESIGELILLQDERPYEDLTVKPIVQKEQYGEENKDAPRKVFSTPWSRTLTADNTELEHNGDKKAIALITKPEVSGNREVEDEWE
jgi:hypothetical protein